MKRGAYGTWQPTKDWDQVPGDWLNVHDWERACGLAQRGQVKQLVALLRDAGRTCPAQAREFFAQLVLSDVAGRSMIRKGKAGRHVMLEDDEVLRIHHVLVTRDWGSRRNAIIERLAKDYNVTPTTIREIAAARRKRYRDLVKAQWNDPSYQTMLAERARHGPPETVARVRRERLAHRASNRRK